MDESRATLLAEIAVVKGFACQNTLDFFHAIILVLFARRQYVPV